MSSTSTADPVRAQVEDVLRQVVVSVAAVPCELARRVREASGRMADRFTGPVGTAFGVARTLGALTLGGALGTAQPRTDPAARAPAPSARPEPHLTVAADAVEVDRERPDPGADDLPLEDYESLAASHVVARLSRLSRTDLMKIREFEVRHRGRRTILGKIEQLLDV